MNDELLSLSQLTLPIIIYLLICLFWVLISCGKANFVQNFISNFFDGLKVFYYPASLYYIALIFDAIHTDAVMEAGIKIIIGICWFITIIKLVLKEENS